MQEDYIRTARAKGVGAWDVLRRHALPNAMAPVIALLGLSMPSLVGGAVLIEKIFGIVLVMVSIGVIDFI